MGSSRDHVADRPVLIVMSESPSLPAQVRSRDRKVMRWSAEGGSAEDGAFAGDPAEPSTYEWARAAPAVTAVVDLEPVSRARAALSALRDVRPDAAVLLLSMAAKDLDGESDGTLVRGGELRDVLRLDLDEELERLEAERRAFCLREFAAGDDVVPILIHSDPDPDAVSSALAVATLLGGLPDRTPLVTLDEITRPENRRMADLLHIRVTQITREELMRFERVITVDTQPRNLQRDGRPRFAVIDHHPPERSYEAEFSDIRPDYGATATMVTEYLRATGEHRVSRPLATALLFGIKTDTDSLMRGVSPADVAAYAFLQSRADLQLVRRFEKPSYGALAAQAFGRALAAAELDDELCVAFLGTLGPEDTHVLADLADFCLGIENITWVVAAAWIEGGLVLTLRHAGAEPGAGELASRIARLGGSGGGHATMARVTLPASRARDLLGDEVTAPAVRRVVRALLDGQELPTRRGLRPAHRA